MRFKYFIPHVWDRPRQSWEDVYLLPDHPEYDGDAIWLTVDALGEPDPTDPEHHNELLARLGDADFHIAWATADMLVRTVDSARAFATRTRCRSDCRRRR